MTDQTWAALIGLLVYAGMKAIDRAFKVVDDVMKHHGIGDDEHKEDTE